MAHQGSAIHRDVRQGGVLQLMLGVHGDHCRLAQQLQQRGLTQLDGAWMSLIQCLGWVMGQCNME
jgi:hypothetical protein